MTALDANAIACQQGPSALRAAIDEAAGHPQPPPGHGPDEALELPLIFWSDLGNPVPPDRLVKQFLGEKTLALLVGDPGSGKSFLATDLALHIALGRPWFGRPVLQGAVVYIAAEGAAGLKNRVGAFRQASGSLPDAVPFVLIPKSVTLGKEGTGVTAVIEAVRRVMAATGQPVRLVVIDTFARTFGVGDENSASDVSQYIRSCDEIRTQTGATVLIVHHRAKHGGGARGSSALMGAVDTCIEIARKARVRVARVIKQKDAADGIELSFDLGVVPLGVDQEGENFSSCVVRPTDAGTSGADLSRMSATVLHALLQAVREEGEAPSSSTGIPEGARIVRVETWRRCAYQLMGPDAKPSSKQRAFKRASDSLLAAGEVGICGDRAWLVPTRTARTTL